MISPACLQELKWHQYTIESYKSRIPVWGLATSPIVEENKLIVQLGGTPGACIVAFNKNTGEEIWRALDDEASYSTPIIINQAGKRVLICWTADSITGLDPETGSTYWSLPFIPRRSRMNIADPVYASPYLFLSSFFDGSYLVKLDQEKTDAELVYSRHGKSERETDALHCCISTPLIDGDYIYGVDSYGEVRCLDLKTGDRIWEDLTVVPKARWANIHFVRQHDKVWGFNEKGTLSLGKLTPEGYMDYGSVKVIDPVGISPNPRNGVCWAHPAFSGNRIYLRSDSKLVCIKL
jgi:outer membrane protein assembly factor BamB